MGCGGKFGKKWFQGKWEPRQQLGQPEISIAWHELFAIVVAYHIWGKFNETMINILSKETLVNLSNFREKGMFRLWGIRMLRICGDEVLPKIALNPIDSYELM